MKRVIAALLLIVLAIALTGCGGSSAWVCGKCHKPIEKGEFCPDCGGNKADRATCAMCKYQPENEWPGYCPKCGKVFMNYTDTDNAYKQAMALMEQEQYESAISILKELNGYSDSDAKIAACKNAIKDGEYAEAKSLMDAEKYEEAINAFKALNGYSDSAAQITVCETVLKDREYAAAQRLMDAEMYEEAIKAFEALSGYSDSAEQIVACENAIPERDYTAAKNLMGAGKYEEAYAAFLQLKGYKDVDDLLTGDENLLAAAAIVARKPYTEEENIVTYGHYEQDNNTSNGKEAIEWIVIQYDAASGKSLLLSRYGLDARRFDESTYQGWDKSEIREWLNSAFLNAAFTPEEQKGIVTTTVETGDNAEWVAFAKANGYSYDTVSGGADTQDKVFLLSLEETMIYGGRSVIDDPYGDTNDKLKAAPTQYALAQGVFDFSTGYYWWWLRSPGTDSNIVSTIDPFGRHSKYGLVNATDVAVRPALWLDLESADIY